jgi:beta-lactamase regulating signal transducer with metallopeptidase domain
MLRWLRIRQFNRRLRLLQHPSEPRLYQVAKQIDLPVDTVGCLRASTAMVVPLAFSSGLWRPKIWISKTTLNLLTDQELAAVLHHEAHHCQQRDPLKRFISHLVSDVFFFVPLLRALETQIHLTQEIAADTNTIDAMGDAIPLASALHKLLTTPKTPPDICANIAISQFNLTEKRIAALISPGQPQPWQPTLSRWVISTAVALLLLGSTTLAQPQKHTQFTACTLDTLPGYTFDLSEFLTVAP